MEKSEQLFCMLRGSARPYKKFIHETVYEFAPFDGGYLVAGFWRSKSLFENEFMRCDENGILYPAAGTPAEDAKPVDVVNEPTHYKSKTGLESIEVIDAFGLNFNLGNAVKYILRAGRKDPAKVKEDLRKAIWYLNHEVESR